MSEIVIRIKQDCEPTVSMAMCHAGFQFSLEVQKVDGPVAKIVYSVVGLTRPMALDAAKRLLDVHVPEAPE